MKYFEKFLNLKIPQKLQTFYPKKNKIKLMIYLYKKNIIIHDYLFNLHKYFNPKDILILNNSKSYPIKYKGYKNLKDKNSKIYFYLLKEINPKYHIWDTIVSPARKVRINNKIFFKVKNKIIKAIILNNTTSRGRILKFFYDKDNISFKKKFFKTGKILLNHNIKKKKKLNINNYQNFYSKKLGSIILPTSGTYFDKNLILNLKLKNIKIFKITLHLNSNKLFNFNIKNIFKYKYFNSEQLFLNEKLSNYINKKKEKKSICCVGSNTLKAIENIFLMFYKIKPFKGYINTFFPYKYKYKIVNSLLTYFNNFESINFFINLNLINISNMYKIYKIAIKKNYNFFTYGDLLLIK
ncbi:MAG: S-adenosylmethionine:tRNA ribosyltransferase-isomerase [Candidatus Shikimatogenerans sp. JK-2022]|nr:S-adenosylmethionine:tRNA ribosyltransferase-isomerase [Candidatus Shikimatogenerans bostrichidophilus]